MFGAEPMKLKVLLFEFWPCDEEEDMNRFSPHVGGTIQWHLKSCFNNLEIPTRRVPGALDPCTMLQIMLSLPVY